MLPIGARIRYNRGQFGCQPVCAAAEVGRAIAFEDVALADMAVPFGAWLGRGDLFCRVGGCGRKGGGGGVWWWEGRAGVRAGGPVDWCGGIHHVGCAFVGECRGLV